MRRLVRGAGGWCLTLFIAGLAAWGCSSAETNPFFDESRGGQSGTTGSGTGGSMSGSTTGGNSNGGSETGGTSGSSTGGDETGGTSTGGSNGDGGAAADSGSDGGGTTPGGMGGTGGTAGAATGGSAGTPMGGAGMGGGGTGGASGGMSGSGGTPGDCKLDTDCDGDRYCKKASCDAETGQCTPRGPDCPGDSAVFAPVCGCDGTTFWNACVLEHAGMNAALQGECTGNNRPTCTREDGGESCPSGGDHARCYRPVVMCGDGSPLTGVCWVLPTECPDDEPQTERYCGGTAGEARCIGLCEVIDAENSFRRDSPTCED